MNQAPCYLGPVRSTDLPRTGKKIYVDPKEEILEKTFLVLIPSSAVYQLLPEDTSYGNEPAHSADEDHMVRSRIGVCRMVYLLQHKYPIEICDVKQVDDILRLVENLLTIIEQNNSAMAKEFAPHKKSILELHRRLVKVWNRCYRNNPKQMISEQELVNQNYMEMFAKRGS